MGASGAAIADAVAIGGTGLGWRVGRCVAVTLGVGVGTMVAVTVAGAVAVFTAGTVTLAVAVGAGRGGTVTADVTVVSVSEVRTGDVGVAMQFVRSSARNRIRVCVQRIIVCASWLSLIAGMGVISVKAPDHLSVRSWRYMIIYDKMMSCQIARRRICSRLMESYDGEFR
jgi:hypothetical protein